MHELPRRLAAAALCCVFAPAAYAAQQAGSASVSDDARSGNQSSARSGAIDITTWDQAALREGYSAGRLLDMKAKGKQGEDVGDVQDILLDRNGRVSALVISHGGIFGIGDKKLRVPLNQVNIDPRLESVVVPITRDNVEQYRIAEDREAIAGGALRVSEMMRDQVALRGGARYGAVQDLIIGRDGRVKAIVVDVDDALRRGAYAVPWREDAYDRPGKIFHYDYARSEVDRLRPFDYTALGITHSATRTAAGRSSATPAGATPGSTPAGSAGGASPASGESGEALAKAKGCMNCHGVDTKKVGPAFKDIAARYKGKPDAVATLTAKLREGKGHPKQSAAEADIRKILDDYVLKQ